MSDDEKKEGFDLSALTANERRRLPLTTRIRNYFLTGLVIAAPIGITAYLTWSFIGWVDDWIKPLIPVQYLPDSYLPFSIPGIGLIAAIIFLILLGFATANFFGRAIVAYGEMLLDQMPLVRTLYRGLKQLFETVLSNTNTSFQKVGLIEYPRKGIWAIAFVSTQTSGEIVEKAYKGEPMLSVFLPTTPNPTSGFLLFVPEKDVIILDMTVEEGAKLVISAGLVNPETLPVAQSDETKGKA